VTWCRREPPVPRKQLSAKFFGKGDVGRIISGQIVTELPNPRQQNVVRVAGHSQVEQILNNPIGEVLWDRAITHQSPQYLPNLKIQEVGSM
jgi:hypothetical protein